MFFKGSRYEKVETARIAGPRGRILTYKKIRFIPSTSGVVGYSVQASDRLDRIANLSFRDPQRFWRICDANLAMWPDDLLIVGAVLEIPPVEG
jgi:hypothetical protein